MMLNSFNQLGYLIKAGKADQATPQLIAASECDEVGLGVSATGQGKRIGRG